METRQARGVYKWRIDKENYVQLFDMGFDENAGALELLSEGKLLVNEHIA